MKTRLTKAQRTALEAARDFGCATAYPAPNNPKGWMPYPSRASRDQMVSKLVQDGLLIRNGGWLHTITEAGLVALG